MKSLAPSSQLSESFYLQPCLDVARQLLGKVLVHRIGGVTLMAELVEVEAYLGDDDPASHAYRRRTPRNQPMFERGGTCYVYLSYGMNFCMNVVTGPEGIANAVLLRAAIPVQGSEKMRPNRNLPATASDRQLLSGPGKLTQGMGIDLSYSGRRFDGPLTLVDVGKRYSDTEIVCGPRIGISKAKDFPYRFCVKGSCWLSRKA